MRTPAFWSKPGLIPTLLAPLSWIWTAETKRRLKRVGVRVDVPVICVGNLTAGGTGKTPVVIALIEHLRDQGVEAHVVTRGYGGSLDGPVRVQETTHRAKHVGDDALLISAFGPCWVAKDRVLGAKVAIEAGAQAILLDDGFQNPSLEKDLSIIVVDAGAGFGNGRVMPAGPLREPVEDGLARADAMLVVGPRPLRATFRDKHPLSCPIGEAELSPLQTGMDWIDLRVLAFAGIGRPEKFFTSLRDAGADIVETRSFGDHASYRHDLLKRLLQEAKGMNAQLVTTEKDAVRLPKDIRSQVLAFPVRLKFCDEVITDLVAKIVRA